jgi:hypothetical protein
MSAQNSRRTKKTRDPRKEKLRDFRNRGNHRHYGIKACWQCGIEYRKWHRKHRLDSKCALRACLRQVSRSHHG